MTLREGGSTIVGIAGGLWGVFAVLTPQTVREYGTEAISLAVIASCAYLVFVDRRAAAKRKIDRENEEAHKGSLQAKIQRLKAERAELIARLHNAGIDYESPVDASDTAYTVVTTEFPAVKP